MKSVFIRVYPWLFFAGRLMAADQISDALQKALFEEEANHNFDAAIKAYQSVIDQTAEQRKFAATAVFRLGECYRKLNKTNDAVTQYQRVLREFSDVTALATLSQQNLSGLGISAPENSTAVAATSAEVEEIAKIKAMIKDSPDLINARDASEQMPLHKAAQNGYLAVARFLLANKADVNARDNGSDMPLHRATAMGHKTMVELLLEHGADVNARGRQLNRPLHLAAMKGYRSIVELLVARKADVNGKGESSRTPLLSAAEKGQVAIAKTLLDYGADVNAQDDSGLSALHDAVSSPELTKLILSYKPNLELQDREGRTPLTAAAGERGDIQCVELLLQARAEVNTGTRITPLMAAVFRHNPEKVRVLLDHKADPNQGVKVGESPLKWVLGAAQAPGNQTTAEKPKLDEIADLLRKHGAKDEGINVSAPSLVPFPLAPRVVRDDQTVEIERLQRLIKDSPDLINGRDERGQTALHRAAAAGQTNVILFLLTNKAEVNIRDKEGSGSTPLHKAVMAGHKPAVELLLANGADVNAMGSGEQDRPDALTLADCQALHMAVKQGNQAIVEILINGKADVNGRDHRGRTPLHFAVHQGFLQLVRLLVSKGADPNAADELGRTPAMLAIVADYQNIFNFLMEQVIDVNAQDKQGRALLHQAVYQRPPRILQTILARKPDLEIGDKDKSTPLIIAVSARNVEAARLLLEAGANPNRQNAQGYFPLFIAAATGSKDAVELLLKYKAEINQKNLQNVTTLSDVTARTASAPAHEQKAFREIADLLRKRGAKEEVSSAKPAN